ncbi:MAG: hypothetical protein WEA09_15510 [Gemmatimonadota bacterium]
MFLDRGRRAPAYPWLEWKVRFFVIGAMLALGGMAMSIEWLVWLAFVFLALGFLTRFLPAGKGRGQVESDESTEPNQLGAREVEDGRDESDWWTSGS